MSGEDSLNRGQSFEVIDIPVGDFSHPHLQGGFPTFLNQTGGTTSGDLVDIAGLVQQVQTLTDDNKQLQTTLKDNNSQLREKMTELSEIKSKQEEALQRLMSQQEHNKAKMLNMASRQKEWETLLEAEKVEKDRLSRELGAQSNDREFVRRLEEELRESRKDRDDLHRECARLTDSVERHIDENRKLHSDLQEMTDQYEEAVTANQEMDDHVRSLTEQKDQLQQQQQVMRGDSALHFADEKEELMSQLHVMTTENQRLRKEVAQLTQTTESLKQQLQQKLIVDSVHHRRELLTGESNSESSSVADSDGSLHQKLESLNAENHAMRRELQHLRGGKDQLMQQLDESHRVRDAAERRVQQLEEDQWHFKNEIDRLQQQADEARQAGSSAALWIQRHEQATKQADQLKLQLQMQERVSQQQLKQAENEKKEVEDELQKVRVQLDGVVDHMKIAAAGSTEGLPERVRQLESENEYLQLQLKFQQLQVHESPNQSASQGDQQQLVELNEEIDTLKRQLEEQNLELRQLRIQDSQYVQQHQKEREEVKQRISELERSLSEARHMLKASVDGGGETLAAQLAAQEYELKQQYQEKVRKVHDQLRKAEGDYQVARDQKKVAEERLESVQERSEKHHQRVIALERQLKATPPVPRPRPEIVRQLQEKNDVLEKENADLRREVEVLKQQVDILSRQPKQLQEKNDSLKKENADFRCEVDTLKQRVDSLNRRVCQELEERERLAGMNRSLEQALTEQSSQEMENKQLKQQFVALSDAHRHLQEELDDALRQRDLQSEKTEELDHHLAGAEQQINIERQRSSAEISGLQQRIQMLEADIRQQHEHNQKQQHSFKEAFDKMQGERDNASYEKQQTHRNYEEVLNRYQMAQQQIEQLTQDYRGARENLDQITARFMSAEELIEEKEGEIKRIEADMKGLQERLNMIPVLQQQSEVWQMDFEAEHEARIKAVEEKETTLRELERVRREAQDAVYFRDENRRLEEEVEALRGERLQELHRRRADTQGYQSPDWGAAESYGNEGYANPNSGVARPHGSYEFQQQQDPMRTTSQPNYRPVECPKCNLQFPDMDTFQIHANDCIQ